MHSSVRLVGDGPNAKNRDPRPTARGPGKPRLLSRWKHDVTEFEAISKNSSTIVQIGRDAYAAVCKVPLAPYPGDE